MRIIGLDVGTKRIGVAVSDALGWTAQGLETIHVSGDDPEESFDRIEEITKQYEAERIVVGLPKNMNGTIGPSGEACKAVAEKLESKLSIPVTLFDERLTTQAVERTLISADVSRKKRKGVVDKMAAVMILQGFLDQQSFMNR